MAGAANKAPVIEALPAIGAQIEARASHPAVADRVFLVQHEREWTFRQYRDESVRIAHFLLRRLGPIDERRPGHVAMLLENHLELLALYGGCAYAGLSLFGVNTGLRGETLAGVLNQSGARVLVVDERLLAEVEKVQDQLIHVAPENVLVLRTTGESELGSRDFMASLALEVAQPGKSLAAPDVKVDPSRNLMTIYTSGTTGLPKGIINNHLKFFLIGKAVSGNLGLGMDDRGYACMPLFHSNAMFLGFHPALEVCASLAIRERFSASSFVPDVLQHGVTYWNYVGEPVHYVLGAIEKHYDGDEARILAEVARNPRNRLRHAVGNGAAPPDIDRFTRWLGLDDMFELYGSTEAAISTFRKMGDPRGSVGEVSDPNVKILDAGGRECPPADVGPDGKIRNYEEAVGEICRVAADSGLFQGYFGNPDASASKFRDGVYHSGDLGHMLVRDGHRFLYFDGRTDDWIRKDGENFSAAQVGRLLQEASRRRTRRGLRRSLRGLGRAGDGGADDAPRGAFRPAGVLRLLRAPGRPRRHGPEVVPRLRARRGGFRVHADPEDPGSPPEGGPLQPATTLRRAHLLARPWRRQLQALQRVRLRVAARALCRSRAAPDARAGIASGYEIGCAGYERETARCVGVRPPRREFSADAASCTIDLPVRLRRHGRCSLGPPATGGSRLVSTPEGQGMSGILSPNESLRRGQELLRAGLEMAALEHFANAHRSKPDDACLRSHYGWAVATIEHRFERGLGLCREALRADGSSADIYLNLSRVLMAGGRKAEGIRYLKRGLMVEPRDATLLLEWRRLGVRRSPVLPFLPRRHLVNRVLGRVRGMVVRDFIPRTGEFAAEAG